MSMAICTQELWRCNGHFDYHISTIMYIVFCESLFLGIRNEVLNKLEEFDTKVSLVYHEITFYSLTFIPNHY